jgi:pimeloyl-ACP methyl ester carboxylesterase
MATYVLIPGAASSPWHWHLLDAELRRRGHRVVAVDLPCDEDAAGLQEYADTVLAAIDALGLINADEELVLVAHSFAGFTAPLVAARRRVDLLVLLNAMVPSPGESPGDWWTATRHAVTASGHDDGEGTDAFFGDLPPDLAAGATAALRDQSGTPFALPWPLHAWPDVPTQVLVSRDDRLFPLAFQHRVVRDRLGRTPDEIDGGHFVALSHPGQVADRLEAYRVQSAAERNRAARPTP